MKAKYILSVQREATNFHNRSAEELFDSDTPDDMDLGSVTMDGDGADSQEDDGFSAGTSAGRIKAG